MDKIAKLLCGDCSTENVSNVIASGEEIDEKEFGVVHTWYVDAPSAMLSGEKAGIHWEVLAISSLDELEIEDEDGNPNKEALNKIEMYEPYYDDDNLETWYRIW